MQPTSSADADKPVRRVYRSVKVTKHGTIPYLRYSFLLCNSNFCLSLFWYSTSKNVVTLKSGSEVTKGHQNQHVLIWHQLTSYYCSIATMGLSRVCDKRWFQSKVQIFPSPCAFCIPTEEVPLELDTGTGGGGSKT